MWWAAAWLTDYTEMERLGTSVLITQLQLLDPLQNEDLDFFGNINQRQNKEPQPREEWNEAHGENYDNFSAGPALRTSSR